MLTGEKLHFVSAKNDNFRLALTVEAIALAFPDELLGIHTTAMILLLAAHAAGVSTKSIALGLRDRDFLSGGALVDERAVIIAFQNFPPLIGLFASHRGRKIAQLPRIPRDDVVFLGIV